MRRRRSANLCLILIFLLGAGIAADWVLRADLRFVSRMGMGWNLSNTLDSHGLEDEAALPGQYETYWGNPATTREMIDAIRAEGFRTLRVPVTWYEHMDDQNRIDPAWMERVRQVVDYGIESGMFVILNAHHDPWYTPDPANLQHGQEMMAQVWTQIAEEFAGYGEKLLFEGMNEPRLIGTAHEWDAGTPEAREAVNRLNEVFVKTVRSGSGYNEKRYLLVPTYCAGTFPEALSDFRLPKGGRVIVSLHLYRPYEFSLDTNGTADWSGSRTDTQGIDQAMHDAERYLLRRRIPVVITEFGAVDKGNEPARAEWVRYVRSSAQDRGIPCIWWDDSVFDRSRLVWVYPEIVRALV